MRHKYATRALVLARSPLGEANALLTLLTREVGIVRARAQSVRRSGAKLSAALATFSESDVVLVRGREGWRLSGAVLGEAHFRALREAARAIAVRFVGLVVRLAPSDTPEPALFALVEQAFIALAHAPPTQYDAIECLAALRLLALLGFDAGAIPEGGFSDDALAEVAAHRRAFIARVNRGIEASGL